MQTRGVILAGGRSTRMGQDKALIEYRGISFLEHAKQLLAKLPVDDITILGRPDDPKGIADKENFQGPAVSLQDWVEQQDKPFRAIVIPVDMPFLTADPLQYLLHQQTAAYFDDLYLPFTGIFDDSVQTRVFRMKDLLRQLDAKCLAPKEKWTKQLVNINKTEDLARLSEAN